ncbi:hypothetical protein ATANTOWER_008618 [Ataeniobius toweri]|uniref:Uncharacterized protein n=1 Tax=Ataeniobius toweri TaxID=208326 RepID=A0ABU7B817_9TELE|nr:hypothetical protein [Ataeniobius toweri]
MEKPNKATSVAIPGFSRDGTSLESTTTYSRGSIWITVAFSGTSVYPGTSLRPCCPALGDESASGTPSTGLRRARGCCYRGDVNSGKLRPADQVQLIRSIKEGSPLLPHVVFCGDQSFGAPHKVTSGVRGVSLATDTAVAEPHGNQFFTLFSSSSFSASFFFKCQNVHESLRNFCIHFYLSLGIYVSLQRRHFKGHRSI